MRNVKGRRLRVGKRIFGGDACNGCQRIYTKKNPPPGDDSGGRTGLRGGNLLSHTRVQYHRRGRA